MNDPFFHISKSQKKSSLVPIVNNRNGNNNNKTTSKNSVDSFKNKKRIINDHNGNLKTKNKTSDSLNGGGGQEKKLRLNNTDHGMDNVSSKKQKPVSMDKPTTTVTKSFLPLSSSSNDQSFKKKDNDDIFSSFLSSNNIKSNNHHNDQTVKDLILDDHFQNNNDEEFNSRKRLHEAKAYIQSLKANYNPENADAAMLDKDIISERLKKDALSLQKKLFLHLADSVKQSKLCPLIQYQKKTNSVTVTALTISNDNQFLYICTKDGLLQQYILDTGNKGIKYLIPSQNKQSVMSKKSKVGKNIKKAKSNNDNKNNYTSLYAVAISPDGNLLVAGGRDNLIHIWNAIEGTYVKALSHHRDIITGLKFKQSDSDSISILFSCSRDRSIKIWNMEEMIYIDTLFGHQDVISSIDCLSKERCITCGSRDRTLRLWKIADESQLVFKVDDLVEGSLDVVVFIDEDHFLSGSDNGTLHTWHVGKKRPLATLKLAHGQGYGILSLACLKYTDIVASGSSDGSIKIWKIGQHFQSIENIFTISMDGFINDMMFTWTDDPKNISLAAAIGQDQKLGRWSVNKKVKNSISLISWKSNEMSRNMTEQSISVSVDESALNGNDSTTEDEDDCSSDDEVDSDLSDCDEESSSPDDD